MSIVETINEIPAAGAIIELPLQRSQVDLVEQEEIHGLTIDEEVRRINQFHALRARERRMDLIKPVTEDTNPKARTRLIAYQGFFPVEYP